MLLCGFMTGIVAPPRAYAQQGFENLDRLDSLVAMSVGANRGQPGGPVTMIDRRLRLAPCPQQPTVDAGQMNAATVSCAALGWRIRVPLVPGGQQAQPAQNPQIARAYGAVPQSVVIKKGDPVQLVAGNEEFSISRMMIADEDGAVGALIRVRQDPKATPVMARVENIGVVRIPGI
ncbi:flagella basal body P-ring formation protein FlgA [Sphingobium nicotianae]|nr:flagella basal body P-ring formation protein FlgA [Sphingobium nicotianae]